MNKNSINTQGFETSFMKSKKRDERRTLSNCPATQWACVRPV